MTSPYKVWQYSGGEVGVRVDDPSVFSGLFRIQSAIDLVTSLMALDAYKNLTGNSLKNITVPYLPYARQDRVVASGDPFASDLVARLFASVGVEEIQAYDVHSKANQQVFKSHGVNLISISPHEMIRSYLDWIGVSTARVALIAPDAGSRGKTEYYCKELGVTRAIQSFKKRDPNTGSLSGFYIDEESSATKAGLERDSIEDLVITDDICDGGGTFLGVAQAFREKYGSKFKLHLWTTHGIYSKGINELLESFETLGCSTSFTNSFSHENLFKAEIK